MFAAPRPRAFALFGGLLLLISLFAVLAWYRATPVRAAASATKDCRGPGNAKTAFINDPVTCTVEVRATAGELITNATVSFTQASQNYTNWTVTPVSPTCTVNSGGTCSVSPLTPAFVFTLTCTGTCLDVSVFFKETLQVTDATPNNIYQNIVISTPPLPATTVLANVFDPAFSIVSVSGPPGRTFFAVPEENVPAPLATAPCTFSNPCTIARAVDLARDADTVVMLPGTTGQYNIKATIRVHELLTIQASSGDKVVLKAIPGITIFEVTAQGGPNLHATIRDFTMGGNYQAGSSAAAIVLRDDYYTEIANNIIGAQDLPINNGIVLSNSDHANIHDNTVQGSSHLTFTPVLEVGRNTSGFGVVTLECFGGTPGGVSDSVTVYRNLFTNQLIAGVWLCSDGAGKHEIRENTFRGNWRGIALKDTTNTTVAANTLTDDRSDGIILYGASLRNTVSGNRVESHIAAAAAGIRVGWIADPVMPLSNFITGNVLIRDTIGIHIFGARTTIVQSNELKISGNRTAVLVTPSTTPLDPGTQPFDTEITSNVIVFIGPCNAVVGCGIRLVGTTVPVLAINNDWGLRRTADVEGVVWHRRDDPVLGQVTFEPFKDQVLATITPSPTPNPFATAPPGATGTPGAGNGNGNGNGNINVMTLNLDPGCAPLSWPGAPGMSVVDAIMTIQPAGAQRTAVIWRRDSEGWKAWGPGLPSGAPRNVFTLERGDQLTICIGARATWTIPTQLGGP